MEREFGDKQHHSFINNILDNSPGSFDIGNVKTVDNVRVENVFIHTEEVCFGIVIYMLSDDSGLT